MALGEGTLTLQETGKALCLGSDAKVDYALLRAPLGNNFITRVGSHTVTLDKGYPLLPGKAIKINNSNLSDIYIIGHSGDKTKYTYSEKGIDNELASRVLLERLLKELKNMNIQLSSITDEELEVK